MHLQKDKFEFPAVDLGEVKRIVIGHDGKGFGSGWYLDKVVIHNPVNEAKQWDIPCTRWVLQLIHLPGLFLPEPIYLTPLTFSAVAMSPTPILSTNDQFGWFTYMYRPNFNLSISTRYIFSRPVTKVSTHSIDLIFGYHGDSILETNHTSVTFERIVVLLVYIIAIFNR